MIKDRDSWFPNYVWKGEIIDLNNDILKEEGVKKIKQKWDNDLLKNERPWRRKDI